MLPLGEVRVVAAIRRHHDRTRIADCGQHGQDHRLGAANNPAKFAHSQVHQHGLALCQTTDSQLCRYSELYARLLADEERLSASRKPVGRSTTTFFIENSVERTDISM